MNGVSLYRITLADQVTGQLLADTDAGSDMNRIETFSDAEGRSAAALDLTRDRIALNVPLRLWLRISVIHSFPPGAHPVFRLFNGDGNWLASVPLLER
jgi:hypothetical protein